MRLANDLAASDNGAVRWPHARLIFLGTGNAGKTCTINALSGKTFVHSESTIGGQTSACVLEQLAVEVAANAREPTPFRTYEPPAEGEEGVSRAQLESERNTLETRLLAFIARRTFGIDSFFPVVGRIDETLVQANGLWGSASQLASR